MRFDKFSFGTLRIDGSTYEQDVIDRGEIRIRKKASSKRFRDEFGHTPLSIEEKIPWKCHRLVIGTGAYGRLPVMKEVKREADCAEGIWNSAHAPRQLAYLQRAVRALAIIFFSSVSLPNYFRIQSRPVRCGLTVIAQNPESQ
jgi:hypothetical protein